MLLLYKFWVWRKILLLGPLLWQNLNRPALQKFCLFMSKNIFLWHLIPLIESRAHNQCLENRFLQFLKMGVIELNLCCYDHLSIFFSTCIDFLRLWIYLSNLLILVCSFLILSLLPGFQYAHIDNYIYIHNHTVSLILFC